MVGRYTSLALTSSNLPVISYYANTNGDLKLAVCNDAACTSPTISTLDSPGNVGEYTSIAVTSSNFPVISYYDRNGDLKLAVCTNAACTSPTISTLDSAGSVGTWTSLALTSSNLPVISYFDATNQNLKLAVCNDATCTSPTISTLDSTGTVWGYTSIAVTSSNLPVISYYDGTNGDLKLAVCNDAPCTSPAISTLDSTGSVGTSTSIALTSSNLPVISYGDGTNGDLKLAVCTDAACTSPTISTLDSAGYVGAYTSIAVTSSNLPVISYYDETNRNLKLYRAPVTVDEGKPNSFAKSTPTNNATITSTSATFTWDAISNATSYEYCIATSTAACTTWTSTGTSTTATNADLVHNTTYYWQVRANNPAGTTYADSMSFGQFTVVIAPAAFNKTNPANNATNQPATVTLTWASSTRATSYEYCVATSTAACTTWTSTGTSTTATKTDLEHNTTYYWQVRANNPAGTTYADSMSFGQFTVVFAPAAFNKTSPADNATNQPATVTFTWAASTSASSYEYCIATSTAACTTWTSTGTSTTATHTGLVHNTTYYWQVRAINAAGTTYADSMSFGQFTVVLAPAAFNKTSPANNATNQPATVTLTWAASTRAASYEYCIALTQAACTNWKSTGTKTTVAVSGLAKAKSYFWQVRAKNTSGTTISSGGYRTFTTQK